MTGVCAATRKDGAACSVQVVGDGRYCWAHDPDLAEKRAETRRKGGHNRANAKRLQKLMPASLVPVWEQLEQVLTDVITGDLSPQQATAAANVARAMCAVLEHGEMEERIRQLEAAG